MTKKIHVLLNLGFAMYAKENFPTFVQFNLKLILQSIQATNAKLLVLRYFVHVRPPH